MRLVVAVAPARLALIGVAGRSREFPFLARHVSPFQGQLRLPCSLTQANLQAAWLLQRENRGAVRAVDLDKHVFGNIGSPAGADARKLKRGAASARKLGQRANPVLHVRFGILPKPPFRGGYRLDLSRYPANQVDQVRADISQHA
jgi:hypothetical protein